MELKHYLRELTEGPRAPTGQAVEGCALKGRLYLPEASALTSHTGVVGPGCPPWEPALLMTPQRDTSSLPRSFLWISLGCIYLWSLQRLRRLLRHSHSLLFLR